VDSLLLKIVRVLFGKVEPVILIQGDGVVRKDLNRRWICESEQRREFGAEIARTWMMMNK
jgi:hypothetical protein